MLKKENKMGIQQEAPIAWQRVVIIQSALKGIVARGSIFSRDQAAAYKSHNDMYVSVL